MSRKLEIHSSDWIMAEPVGKRIPLDRAENIILDRRGRSPIKSIISGASMKAKGQGAELTHAQICQRLEPGLDTLIYGIGLVAAATARDLKRCVKLATYVIMETSIKLNEEGLD